MTDVVVVVAVAVFVVLVLVAVVVVVEELAVTSERINQIIT